MLSRIEKCFGSKQVKFVDNMILSNSRPHTAPVANLTACCCGRNNANYYFVAKYFDKIDISLAEGMLAELKKFQNTDKTSPFYGCMKWYREETCITDTNAAFFILLPLALSYMFCNEKMSDFEKETIKELLNHAGVWFNSQCSGALYYTNKIMSDGAMLALISHITGEYGAECENFWYRWIDYSDRRGWGWGENSSDCYTRVIIDALCAAIFVMDNEDIKQKLTEKRNELMEYITFHGKTEFIPSIRTYNFSGSVNYGGELYKILYRPESLKSFEMMTSSILLNHSEVKDFDFDRDIKNEVKAIRLFDDSYAYTWRGDGIRLGSVSKFPVMPGCYQGKNHGLGWQSMPLSAMIDGKCVSFLKLRTITNGNEHSHPSTNHHDAYLYNRLFEDPNIPNYSFRSVQKDNMVIAVRGIGHLANYAEAIYDEWCIPGNEEVGRLYVNGYNWYTFESNNRAVAVCPLDGVGAEEDDRKKPEVKIMRDNGFTNISKILYFGEGKFLCNAYMESAWVVVALESSENVEKQLEKITISDVILPDYDISRASSSMQKRKIQCTDEKSSISIDIDPYDVKGYL